MIGVSGDMKYVKIPILGGANTSDLVGTSINVSAMLPIIPATDKGKSGNNLSITARNPSRPASA